MHCLFGYLKIYIASYGASPGELNSVLCEQATHHRPLAHITIMLQLLF